MLTALQKERIAFHLEYSSSADLLTISRSPVLISLNNEQQFQLVGPMPPDAEYAYDYMGVELCDRRSLLGRVEAAHAKLGSDTIEDSLYVIQAGTVTLRGSELQKRTALYQSLCADLAKIVGGDYGTCRVGWSDGR